ncbi:hypothetical protein K3495_g651 [Podosphaera aphanis]|nr:hypothetical protein K3495_g651 [Podosphaera aphanis]
MIQPDHLEHENPPTYIQALQSSITDSAHLSSKLSLPSLSDSLHHDQKPPHVLIPRQEQKIQPGEEPSTCNSIGSTTTSDTPILPHLTPNSNDLSQKSMTISTNMDTPNAPRQGMKSTLSIDDPDVRLAAQALQDLRADFIGSPQKTAKVAYTPPLAAHGSRSQRPEPLLSLLTTSHPLIGNAIGGSLSAYSASKNYSPRFKSSAEFVEKQFIPVVNTVGSVGRMTGVEDGVRWFLGEIRPSHHAPSDSDNGIRCSKRRRKLTDDELNDDDEEETHHNPVMGQFHTSQQKIPHLGEGAGPVNDSLPAYRDHLSGGVGLTNESLPAYKDIPILSDETHQFLSKAQPQQNSTSQNSWRSRLVTSSLSVALSSESLDKLGFCLERLRWGNQHVDQKIRALRRALEQYDSLDTTEENESIEGNAIFTGAENSTLNKRIEEIKNDLVETLKEVFHTVSTYAAPALSSGSRALVRHLVTSLPHRFLKVHQAINRNGEQNNRVLPSRFPVGARRVVILAQEGLGVMAQITCIVDSTIRRTENWVDHFGP